jgi:hypothetical protein
VTPRLPRTISLRRARADAKGFGECVDAHLQGNKVVLFEGFSGVRWLDHFSTSSSMVIDDFHVMGFGVFPAEAEPVLIVDSDAVLALGGGTTGARTFLPALPLQPAEHDQSR